MNQKVANGGSLGGGGGLAQGLGIKASVVCLWRCLLGAGGGQKVRRVPATLLQPRPASTWPSSPTQFRCVSGSQRCSNSHRLVLWTLTSFAGVREWPDALAGLADPVAKRLARAAGWAGPRCSVLLDLFCDLYHRVRGGWGGEGGTNGRYDRLNVSAIDNCSHWSRPYQL